MWCDGFEDCDDGSDERKNCGGRYPFQIYFLNLRKSICFVHWALENFLQSYLECPSSTFKCRNKRCVKISSTCDGVNDCGDNSDETIPCAGNCNLFNLDIYHVWN